VAEFDGDVSGFNQHYDATLREAQRVVIYCRLCRKLFPVTLRARPRVKVRCVCGHTTRLGEFDVFGSEQDAQEFAAFYGKIISAVNDALREANIPVPPSGRYVPPYREGDAEDESDIRSAYLDQLIPGGPAQEEDDDSYLEEQRDLEQQLIAAEGDILETHDLLSELIELTYCHRNQSAECLQDCVDFCKRDIALAGKVIREAKRLLRAGQRVRLSFSSFKHLAILNEEDERYEEAIAVAEEAIGHGLKGYDERLARLRAQLREFPQETPLDLALSSEGALDPGSSSFPSEFPSSEDLPVHESSEEFPSLDPAEAREISEGLNSIELEVFKVSEEDLKDEDEVPGSSLSSALEVNASDFMFDSEDLDSEGGDEESSGNFLN